MEPDLLGPAGGALFMTHMVHADQIHSTLLPLSKQQRQGHDQQFVLKQCRTQYRQFSFLPRSMREWNELPLEAVAARTLDTFVSIVSYWASLVKSSSTNTVTVTVNTVAFFFFLFFLFLRNADPQ